MRISDWSSDVCSSDLAERLSGGRSRSHSAPGRGRMTIAREIETLIARLDGVAVCDGCITDTLNLSVPAQATVVTRALAGQLGFERQNADCGLCGAAQTEHVRRAGRERGGQAG